MRTKANPLIFVGIGALLWLLFLIFIRAIGPGVFTAGNPLLLLMFLAAFPMVLVLIILIAAMTSIPKNEMTIPIVIISITALMMDGLAIGFTDLYGPTPEQVVAGAAYLLWGVGASLIVSLWLEQQQRQ